MTSCGNLQTTRHSGHRTPGQAQGAPNVVMIVLDDAGFAQLGAFGSDIATPHIDRLAQEGLLFNRFHVTALCSPTRASLLSGRNHHAVGMGFLVDTPMALPGYSGRIPKSSAPLPRVLKDGGYNTLGRWQVAPPATRSAERCGTIRPLAPWVRFRALLRVSSG